MPDKVPENRRILLIGLPASEAASGAASEAHGGAGEVIHARFAALSEHLLDATAPELVICPLVAQGFDAVELAERLAGLDWSGRLCVVSPPIPDISMVRAELRAAVSGLGARIQVDVLPA